ncbi:hypothetical protein BUE80_DR006775 [Diplocarpon rosae]|nr:hypothetical protein BUE80_DR006775 [Diplocarpon rosae]
MIHFDHSLPHTLPPSSPESAMPILASHLLELEETQRRNFTGNGGEERLSTGCKDIDEVLGGGVERGVMLGVSSNVEGFEGRLLSLNLVASALLPRLSLPKPTSKAIVIDTTGSFPLALLLSVLKSRILANHSQCTHSAVENGIHWVNRPGQDETGISVDEEAQRCLEMVALCRVFDVEGLWEVLGEIGQDPSSGGDPKTVAARPPGVKEDEPEILDSQEEDLSSEVAIPVSPSLANPSLAPIEETDAGPEIIIIDNMTHIISELLARKEKREAHTFLTLLSSSLHTLTTTHNILTVVHNTTTPSVTKPSYSSGQQAHHTVQRSIFASTTTKPALGQVFSQFPDLHIFLHDMPRRREDAEALYGRDGEAVPPGEGSVEYCTLIEVLKDECPILGRDREKERRFAWREQRWTAVTVDGAGTGLVAAFAERGGCADA